jgi:hypothetical protein
MQRQAIQAYRPYALTRKFIAFISQKYRRLINWMQGFMLALTIGGFIAGIASALFSSRVSAVITKGMSVFVDGYSFVAPLAIFVILASSLARIVELRKGRFASYAISWFARRRLFACLWAAAFTSMALNLPASTDSSQGLAEASWQTLKSLGWLATHSSYFLAMYVAIAAVIVSTKVKRLARLLNRCAGWLEASGEFFLPLIPLFMFSVGAYIYRLPVSLQEKLSPVDGLHSIKVFGVEMTANAPFSLIFIYMAAACLTGFACFLWHAGLLVIARREIDYFSIRDYF